MNAPQDDQRRTLVAKLDRHEAAIMLTDIVGYTRLMRADEERALQLLEEHNAIVRDCVEKHAGFVAKVMGDAFLVEFFEPLESFGCALEIQSRLSERNAKVGEEHKVFVRIGMHFAVVTPLGSDIIGDGVNVVSRIEPLSPPGGVCFSAALYDRVKERLTVKVQDMGPQSLKNIDEPVHLYQIEPSGAPSKESFGPPSEIDLMTHPDVPRASLLGRSLLGRPAWQWAAAGAAILFAAAAGVGIARLTRSHAAPAPVSSVPPAPPPKPVAKTEEPPPEIPAPELPESPKPETIRAPDHHLVHASRHQKLHERVKRVLSEVEKLPSKKQKKLVPDLEGWKKTERELAQGKRGLDLDGIERRLTDLERQISKG